MSKCKYVSTEKAYEILDDNWTKLDNPRYDDYELTQALIKAINSLDRDISVLKALEDVLAKIHEAGVLDHYSDEIEVALAYGKVETIIEQKIAEVMKNE